VTTESGATWSRLGPASRINGGWEWQGATLPASGHLSARARVAGGHRNAFSSLVESVTLFGRAPTAIEEWRLHQFNSPLNQGAGHDTADSDLDGLPNLLEYALGLDPQTLDAHKAPQWSPMGDVWEWRLPRLASSAGVSFSAEWSPTLLPDSWMPAEDNGTESEHRFQVPFPTPGSHSARFFRWRVHALPSP